MSIFICYYYPYQIIVVSVITVTVIIDNNFIDINFIIGIRLASYVRLSDRCNINAHGQTKEPFDFIIIFHVKIMEKEIFVEIIFIDTILIIAIIGNCIV